MDAPLTSEHVFRYRVARHTWPLLALAIGAVTAVIVPAVVLQGGIKVLTEEGLVGIYVVMGILGVVLLPVPIMNLAWAARGQVTVGVERLSWRGFGGNKSLQWSEIVAIGMPPENPTRVDDQRIHVLTDDEYDFIHGFGLRDRQRALELMLTYGDLPEREQVGSYTFACRSGTSANVAARAGVHLGVSDDDPWGFWGGRFRRF
ncbi:MAG: hypothetical protein U9R79_01135 [Armatimonadota bacterium]|nr:hypothetical protein [Armatimonadota bacterium]